MLSCSLNKGLAQVITSRDSADMRQKLVFLEQASKADRGFDVSRLALAVEYLRVAGILKDTFNLRQAHANLGSLYIQASELDSSLYHYSHVLKYDKALRDTTGKVKTYAKIAMCYNEQGETGYGLIYFRKALNIAKTQGDNRLIASLHRQMGAWSMQSGLNEEAVGHYVRAVGPLKNLEENNELIETYLLIGTNHYVLHRYGEALNYFQEGQRVATRIGDSVRIARSMGHIGRAYLKMDSLIVGKEVLDDALSYAIHFEDTISMSLAFQGLAELAVHSEDWSLAIADYKKAIELEKGMGEHLHLPQLYFNLGSIYYTNQVFPTAIKWLSMCLSLAEEQDDVELQSEAFKLLSKLHYQLGDYEQAYHMLKLKSLLSDSIQATLVSRKLNEVQAKYERELNGQSNFGEDDAQGTGGYFWQVAGLLVLILGSIGGVFWRRMRVSTRQDEGKLVLEKQLEDARMQLDALYPKLDQQVQREADMLHSLYVALKLPLDTILGMTELLQKSRISNSVKSYVQIIEQSVSSLQAFSAGVLDFGKVNANRVKLEIRPGSVHQMSQLIADKFETAAAEKGLELDVYCDTAISTVINMDQPRLKQVLENLVDNAIRYTSSGAVNVSIELLHKENTFNGELQKLYFKVSDTGIGIPEELIDEVFDTSTHRMVKGAKEYVRLGVGLVTAHKLVAMMGGTLYVESNEEQGTVFEFELTFKGERQSPYERAKKLRRGKSKPLMDVQMAMHYPALVCIVEDNEVNQTLLRIILEKLGYNPLIANNGEELLTFMKDHPIDIIFMDIQMPVMDGITATTNLRSTYLRKPAIIAVTANASPEERDSYLEVGMQDVISKPYTAEQIAYSIIDWYHLVKLMH